MTPGPGKAGSGHVVVALGGNAIAPGTDPFESSAIHQREHIAVTSTILADSVAAGVRLVITHGNGPQVGNLLIKNEKASDVVPPVPLDWCVAQTQATIGMELASTLTAELRRRGLATIVMPVLSRVLVDGEDDAFQRPSKPIGRYVECAGQPDDPLPTGHRWVEVAPSMWRRAVPSPRPLQLLDTEPIDLVLAADGIPIACGGGSVPVVRDGDRYVGVEAVIDKDSTAVLLAEYVNADRLVILTDVAGAAIGFATPQERFLGEVSVSALEAHLADQEFGEGSMAAKVRAAIEFVRRTSREASIGSLSDARSVMAGLAGTRIRAAVAS